MKSGIVEFRGTPLNVSYLSKKNTSKQKKNPATLTLIKRDKRKKCAGSKINFSKGRGHKWQLYGVPQQYHNPHDSVVPEGNRDIPFIRYVINGKF